MSSTNNNVSVTFLSPVPESAREAFQRIIQEQRLSDDWDGEAAQLDRLAPGRTVLMQHDVTYTAQQELVELAKEHQFSIIVHCEDFHYEGGPGCDIHAWDARQLREVQVQSDPGGEIYVPLKEALTRPLQDLEWKYSMPVELEEKEAPAQ